MESTGRRAGYESGDSSFNNKFFEYLCNYICFDQEKLEAMMKRYPIGSTEQNEPIFWHINAENKVINGHIITMDSDTGNVYDESWYYQDERHTCLFGENLLDNFPSQTVALVKSEMTAAIMSCFPTPYIWLATGKENVAISDLFPLEGRSVVVFPDKGEYDRWKDALGTIPNLQFHVSDVIEKPQGDCHNITQMVLYQQPLRPSDEEAALMKMEETSPNLALLVRALDLEVVSVSDAEDTTTNFGQKSKAFSSSTIQSKDEETLQTIKSEQEKRWHGKNRECHQCDLSHEGINGTYCNKLHRYVEYGKSDCGQ